MLVEESTHSQVDSRNKGAQIFIVLCRLTKLLGEVLSIVYTLPSVPLEQTLKLLRRIDAYVEELEDSLPPSLGPDEETMGKRPPGALNLQLSFLAVKMCICRAALQATRTAHDNESQYYETRCIKAGNALIRAVVSLSAEKLTTAFWLPCKSLCRFTSVPQIAGSMS